MDQKFPIKTATACQLKWTWSTLWLTSGTTASCHRIDPDKISIENFQNFHNTPKKLSDRELMLKGEWPTGGCEYCQSIEAAGGQSDRKYYLGVDRFVPPELKENPIATVVTPRVVEIFINNTCNLKCVYCDPMLSSSIQKENKEFGTFKKDNVVIYDYNPTVTNRDRYVDEFFIWLEKNYMHLERFHILGGEPFLIKEIDKCLDFWVEHPNPDLTINIISNLMIKEKTLQKYVDKLNYLVENKFIKGSNISGSIDCWGPAAVYTRNGLNLDTFENNVLYILKSNITTLGLYSVITSTTLWDFPKLQDKIKEWRSVNLDADIHHGYQFNTAPQFEFMHPKYLGKDFWKNTFDEIFSKYGNRDHHIEEMHGIKALIDTGEFDEKQITDLHIYLNELDRRRGTNWREIFPYLDILPDRTS